MSTDDIEDRPVSYQYFFTRAFPIKDVENLGLKDSRYPAYNLPLKKFVRKLSSAKAVDLITSRLPKGFVLYRLGISNAIALDMRETPAKRENVFGEGVPD